MHTAYLYQTNSHRYLFGCHQGFLNDFALFRHTQKHSCEKVDNLLERTKTCKQCVDTTPDIISTLNYLEDGHGHPLSVNGSPYVCAVCAIGFHTEELLWGHLVLVGGISISHTAAFETHNMWYPAPVIVYLQSRREEKWSKEADKKKDSNYGA